MSVAMLRQQDLSAWSPDEARRHIAAGRHKGSTANMAPGHVQGNVVILPERLAFNFLAFCHANAVHGGNT